jgi:hypothetical protein
MQITNPPITNLPLMSSGDDPRSAFRRMVAMKRSAIIVTKDDGRVLLQASQVAVAIRRGLTTLDAVPLAMDVSHVVTPAPEITYGVRAIPTPAGTTLIRIDLPSLDSGPLLCYCENMHPGVRDGDPCDQCDGTVKCVDY